MEMNTNVTAILVTESQRKLLLDLLLDTPVRTTLRAINNNSTLNDMADLVQQLTPSQHTHEEEPVEIPVEKPIE